MGHSASLSQSKSQPCIELNWARLDVPSKDVPEARLNREWLIGAWATEICAIEGIENRVSAAETEER